MHGAKNSQNSRIFVKNVNSDQGEQKEMSQHDVAVGVATHTHTQIPTSCVVAATRPKNWIQLLTPMHCIADIADL